MKIYFRKFATFHERSHKFKIKKISKILTELKPEILVQLLRNIAHKPLFLFVLLLTKFIAQE